MLRNLWARFSQGYRTIPYPKEPPTLPERFRGRPLIDRALCPPNCSKCVDACPTDALQFAPDGKPVIDLGRCLFCTDCAEACPETAIRYQRDHRLATRTREALLVHAHEELKLADALQGEMRRLFGRSLKLREVSAGGCNGCEVDVNVLSTIGFDLGRFGIQFVASPRHAEGILVTGPITENMRVAVQKTYDAVAHPKLVIAVGACAIAGGPFIDLPAVNNGIGKMLPVDLYIPGCPPHPITILDGLLRLLGGLPAERVAGTSREQKL